MSLLLLHLVVLIAFAVLVVFPEGDLLLQFCVLSQSTKNLSSGVVGATDRGTREA
jgi:hypothetical protein